MSAGQYCEGWHHRIRFLEAGGLTRRVLLCWRTPRCSGGLSGVIAGHYPPAHYLSRHWTAPGLAMPIVRLALVNAWTCPFPATCGRARRNSAETCQNPNKTSSIRPRGSWPSARVSIRSEVTSLSLASYEGLGKSRQNARLNCGPNCFADAKTPAVHGQAHCITSTKRPGARQATSSL